MADGSSLLGDGKQGVVIPIPWLEEWPRCYYDRERFCGDPAVDNHLGLGYETPPNVREGWHVAGFCDCPSCPIRCAVRDELARRQA